jgi:hypothetical protein
VSALPSLFVQHASLPCHHLLLQCADVMLHHGGSGTTAAALAAGVPQLVCPLQFDQFYWVSAPCVEHWRPCTWTILPATVAELLATFLLHNGSSSC